MADLIHNDVILGAYCLTYGFTSETDECIDEPTMIQDSSLITEDIVKQFAEHPDVKMLTFSTGDANNERTMLTFQLNKLEPEYSDLFALQMTNNSNGLYVAKSHEVESGKFISISTNNFEDPDTPNLRLTQWIKQSFDVVDITIDRTKDFVPDMRIQYDTLVTNYKELEPTIAAVIETIENGEDTFTEQAVIDSALSQLNKDIVQETINKILQLTAVRDTIESPTTAATSMIGDITDEIATSVNISNFDTVNNSIMDIVEKLSSLEPSTVQSQIEIALSNLSDIPSDAITEYTQAIMDKVDEFPFVSIDSIKAYVLDLGIDLESEYGDVLDFIANPQGEIIGASTNVMEEFGILAAKDTVTKILKPGAIGDVIESVSKDAVTEALSQLPIDDINAIRDNVKSLKQYTDIIDSGGGDASKYLDQIIEAGLEQQQIKNVISGVKTKLDEFEKAIDQVESGVTTVMETVDSLGEIGTTIETQMDEIKSYANKAQTFINTFSLQRDFMINTEIAKIVDMSLLLRDAAAAVSQSCGSGGGAKCLLSYGLNALG